MHVTAGQLSGIWRCCVIWTGQGGDRLLVYTPGGGGFGDPGDGDGTIEGTHRIGSNGRQAAPARSGAPQRRASGRVHNYNADQLSG